MVIISHKTVGIKVFLLCLLDDRRIRIRTTDQRIRILEAQKHTYPDTQHWSFSRNASLNVVAVQVLSTRKRKDVAEADVKVQVCLFGFDLLYLNGESLVTRPFQVCRNRVHLPLFQPGLRFRIPLLMYMRCRIRLFISMRIHAFIVSVHCRPGLYFELLKLLNLFSSMRVRIQLYILMPIRIRLHKIGLMGNPDFNVILITDMYSLHFVQFENKLIFLNYYSILLLFGSVFSVSNPDQHFRSIRFRIWF